MCEAAVEAAGRRPPFVLRPAASCGGQSSGRSRKRHTLMIVFVATGHGHRHRIANHTHY